MSHEPKPSEHAIAAAYQLCGGTIEAEIIDQHAIAPAVAEANAAANVRIDARDKQWDDLWASLNKLGIEAVVDGCLIYEDGKNPVAERDRRIAELEEVLNETATQLKHVEELRHLSAGPIPATLTHDILSNADRILAKSERSAP